MALAPLSQTLLLTEDGSTLDVGAPVKVPPAPVGATLSNTPVGSALALASVVGASAAFDSLETTAGEQDARLDQLEAA